MASEDVNAHRGAIANIGNGYWSWATGCTTNMAWLIFKITESCDFSWHFIYFMALLCFTMLYYALVPPKAACFHGFLIFALPASSRPRKRQIRSKSSKVGERLAAGSSQVWRRSSRTFSTGSCEENGVETWSIP